MSAFENVVIGKLKLKGKPLDVKSSGSQKKKNTKRYSFSSAVAAAAAAGGENAAVNNTILSRRAWSRWKRAQSVPGVTMVVSPKKLRAALRFKKKVGRHSSIFW